MATSKNLIKGQLHAPIYQGTPKRTVSTSVRTQVKKPHQRPSCALRKFHPSNVLGGTLYKSIQHNVRLYSLHGTGILATTTIYYSLSLHQCAQNIISMNHISSLSSKPANYLSKYVHLVTNKTLFHHHRYQIFPQGTHPSPHILPNQKHQKTHGCLLSTMPAPHQPTNKHLPPRTLLKRLPAFPRPLCLSPSR